MHNWLCVLQLRDFIHESLYGKEGYFTKGSPTVATLPEPLEFSTLLGRSDYQTAVANAYNKLKVRHTLMLIHQSILHRARLSSSTKLNQITTKLI